MENPSELVKVLIVRENADILKAKYLSVYDGTGVFTPKKLGGKIEIKINNKHYHVPYVGSLYKERFPELGNLSENGEITDQSTIQKIKENIM